MKIEIEDLYGDKFNLDVELENSVGNVKAKMQEQEDISAEFCDLFANSRLLDDSTTLGELEIEEGSKFLFCLSHEKMKAKKAADKKTAEEKAKKAKKEAEENAIEGAEKAKKEAKEKTETAKNGQMDDHRSGNPALVSKNF